MNKFIENPFESFWMAGFECSDQLNNRGDRVDFLHITSHFDLINQDYEALAGLNVKVVREGVRWSQIELKPNVYDFSLVEQMILAGRTAGIQQIWDLCHFGFPDDLSPLHPQFVRRFESFCRAFASFYRNINPDQVLIVTPINEVGFMSWLGGDVAGTSPYCHNNGWHVKYGYLKAYIAGVRALKEIDPNVRILTTEPLVNITFKNWATEADKEKAALHHEFQYQVLDMLCGRICPELGGKEEYLDLIGCNYYYNNQWTLDPHYVLPWDEIVPEENFKPLSEMIMEVYKRYDRPIVLAETSHPGVDRPKWIQRIGEESIKLLKANIPFWGVCWYPIIDRPDWDNLVDWHHSGIWDSVGDSTGEKRVLHQLTADALMLTQQKVAPALNGSEYQKRYQIDIKSDDNGRTSSSIFRTAIG